MKLHNIIFLLSLLTTGYTSPMDHADQIDPQNESSLTAIPRELLPQILHFQDTWHMVRATLALQQTCRLWNSILNTVQKKNMVSVWINQSNQFNENGHFKIALEMLSQRMQFLRSNSEDTRSRVNHSSAPELYLLAGADVNHASKNGDSPLICAINGANVDDCSLPYIKLLIDKGANINYTNQEGDTALHFATKNDALNCVELLLQHGAHTDIKNNKQQTPTDLLPHHHNYLDLLPPNHSPLVKMYVRLKRERILSLLKKHITPQESIEKPILEEEDQKTTALDALNGLLVDDFEFELAINKDLFE